MILALDQATTTGACWGEPACERPETCAVHFRGDESGEVLSRFTFWLRTEMLHKLKPTHVVRENVYFPRPANSFPTKKTKAKPPPPINIRTLARLLAMAETVDALCWELGIKCFEVTPAEVTRRFLGKGVKLAREQKKQAYIRRCAELGWDTASTDVADACGIWFCAEAEFAPEASARRFKVAADYVRLADGGGPLFTPRNADAPGPLLPGAKGNLQSEEQGSSNAQQQYTQFGTGTQRRDFIGRRSA